MRRKFEELWHHILAKREAVRERKRVQHADNIKHALMVLEDLRHWDLENSKSRV